MPLNLVYSDGASVQKTGPAPGKGPGQGKVDKGKLRATAFASSRGEDSTVSDCLRHKGQTDNDTDKVHSRLPPPRVPICLVNDEAPYVPARLRERDTVGSCLNHDGAPEKDIKKRPPVSLIRDRVVPPWVIPSSGDDASEAGSRRGPSSIVSARTSVARSASTLPKEMKKEMMKRVQSLSKELHFEMKQRQELEKQRHSLVEHLNSAQDMSIHNENSAN